MPEAKQRKVRGKYFAIILLLAGIIGASIYWQDIDQKNKQAEQLQDRDVYVSPSGEFAILAPKDWLASERSSEENGYTFIELVGPRNQAIEKAFIDQTQVESDSIADAFANQRYDELISSSVIGREYALLQVEAITAANYSLPTNIEAWKKDLLDSGDTASGLGYSSFEKFEVEGGSGYRYKLTSYQADGNIEAIGYYILGPAAEIEAFLYPANSNYAQEADDIMRSIIIAENVLTTEDLDIFSN